MSEKVGRPTVMTDKTIAKLEEGFTMGFSDEEACLYANINKVTLYRYCKDNEEFSNRKEILKNHPKILAKRNIYGSLEDGKRLEDSRWYLERKVRKEFGNNIDVNLEAKIKLDPKSRELADEVINSYTDDITRDSKE